MSDLQPAGKAPPPVLVATILRPLGEADLPLLVSPPALAKGAATISSLRHTHHLLARALAEGMSNPEAAALTGYNPAVISRLRGDPTFKELVFHYTGERRLANTDVMERMRDLGIDCLEEMQSRLNGEGAVTEPLSHRELMELAELLLVKGRQAPGVNRGQAVSAPGNAGPALQVNVQFVQAKPPDIAVEAQTIDQEGVGE